MDPKKPDIYAVVGGIFKGEMDEGTNWQRVVYALDGLKVDGVGSNLTFYNAFLEALWCLGQRQRACRVLEEAKKRGVYAEAFSRSDLMWSIDVHRSLQIPYLNSLGHNIRCKTISISYEASPLALIRYLHACKLISYTFVAYQDVSGGCDDYPCCLAASLGIGAQARDFVSSPSQHRYKVRSLNFC